MTRAWSDITVTDVFCGAGGNTIGAKKAGLRVRVGLNHWQRAIDTYGTNNPEVDVVERVDVSLCDPRRYPSTDIGIFSPECTTHSPAGGNRHVRTPQKSLFPRELDPATVRSRVTMFDVVRFTEYHRYRIVVVENVVEATRWELFEDWLLMMDRLGYNHRILSLNSMFFHPTPQSRDRIYVVFWKKGNRPPVLEYRPLAPCPRDGIVEAVQAWKPMRTIGKYRRQYLYLCAKCAAEVTPFYYAALNALDFSLAAERIGDRKTPLKPRTMERVRYGLEKFGGRVLVIRDGMTSGTAFRVAPADGAPHFAQAATRYPLDGVVQPSPFLIETGQTHSDGRRPRSLTEPLPTMGGQQTSALVSPMILSAGSREVLSRGTDPMPTQTGSERLAVVGPVVVPLQGTATPSDGSDPLPTQLASCAHDWLVQQSPFIVGLSHGSGHPQPTPGDHAFPAQTTAQDMAMVVPLRTNGRPRPVDEELPTVAASGHHHLLVQSGGFIAANRANNVPRSLDESTPPATTAHGGGQFIVQKAPFLVSYYGNEQAMPADYPVASITTVDRHSVVTPDLRAEDCYFRMLQPHEIGAAMAFPSNYLVGGNKRDRVKQYGNAVTPPVMDWIVRQCAATLAPELEGGEVA
jgi:DNA (cytosine-5)-methyltransferase 1